MRREQLVICSLLCSNNGKASFQMSTNHYTDKYYKVKKQEEIDLLIAGEIRSDVKKKLINPTEAYLLGIISNLCKFGEEDDNEVREQIGCWACNETLMKELGYENVRQVQRLIKSLAKSGYIKIVYKDNEKGIRTRYLETSLFRFQKRRIQKSTELSNTNNTSKVRKRYTRQQNDAPEEANSTRQICRFGASDTSLDDISVTPGGDIYVIPDATDMSSRGDISVAGGVTDMSPKYSNENEMKRNSRERVAKRRPAQFDRSSPELPKDQCV